MAIKAFGKEVDRERAYEMIFGDLLNCCYSGCTDELWYWLLNGWKPLNEWSDQELEEYIDTLCESNQPSEKIIREALPTS